MTWFYAHIRSHNKKSWRFDPVPPGGAPKPRKDAHPDLVEGATVRFRIADGDVVDLEIVSEEDFRRAIAELRITEPEPSDANAETDSAEALDEPSVPTSRPGERGERGELVRDLLRSTTAGEDRPFVRQTDPRPLDPPAATPRQGFVNPYTFVPLPATEPVRSKPTSHAAFEGRSGHIDVTLTVKSALFTAGETHGGTTQTLELEGRYALAGSGLKGMVRSLFETMTGSCLAVLDSELGLSTRAEADEALRYPFVVEWGRPPGAMNDMPCLLPARATKVEPGEDLAERVDGEPVRFVEHGGIAQIVQAGGLRGRLKLSDHTPGKKHQWIITETEATEIELTPEMVEEYDLTVSVSRREDRSRLEHQEHHLAGQNGTVLLCHEGNTDWGWRRVRDRLRIGDVVWGDHPRRPSAIAPSQIYRRTFNNTRVRDAVPPAFLPCADPEQLCPACRVFGMVSRLGQDEAAFASHTRLSWGLGPQVPAGAKKQVTLPPLLSPKPTHGPFYLKPKGESEGSTWDDSEVEIAGRKVYWHSRTLPQVEEGNRFNRKVVPAPSKTRFGFRVRFDNLTDWEVGLLMLSLQPSLWAQRFPNAWLKFGGGRPAGLGSVEPKVETVHLIDRRARYRSFDNDEARAEPEALEAFVGSAIDWLKKRFGDDQGHLDHLAAALDPGSTKEATVRYPDGGYEWFARHSRDPVLSPLLVKDGHRQNA